MSLYYRCSVLGRQGGDPGYHLQSVDTDFRFIPTDGQKHTDLTILTKNIKVYQVFFFSFLLIMKYYTFHIF